MKVGQRHCVPFSFSPLGPNGRGQIQKERPRFIPGFFVVNLIHGSWCPSHGGTGFLVKSFDQSSLLTIGSIIVSSMNFLAVGPSVEISASSLMLSSCNPGDCRLISGYFPFSCDCPDGSGLSDGVEDPDKGIGDWVVSDITALGLKKPVNIFWSAAEPPEDVDTADLVRFADVVGRGCERLRETV